MIRKYYASDFTVGGRVELDATGGIKSMKELKQSIRDAQLDLINMQEKFGATSTEAINAAKRVAQLKDTIGDANELVNAFNPDEKFRALGSALNGVLGGFTALTGAMSLLGIESEDVQKQLLKVQSALALSQGLNQIGASINSFKALGQTIVQTLGKGGAIGLAIAGVGALALAMSDLFKRNTDLIEANNEYKKSLTAARLEVAQIRNTFEQAKLGIISKDNALKQYNQSIGQTIGQAKDLNEAEMLLAKNADDYVKVQGLKAKANYILQQSAEASARAELVRLDIRAGMPAEFRAVAERELAKLEQRAKSLEGLVADINGQIAAASSGFQKTTEQAQTQETRQVQQASSGRVREDKKDEGPYMGRESSLFGGEFAGWKQSDISSFLAKQQELEMRKQMEENFQKDRAAIIAQGVEEEKQAAMDSVLALLDAEDRKVEKARQAAEARVNTMRFVANQSAIFADLAGRETAAGKVLAIASATINTYLAATEALKANYTAYGPAAQFVRIATVVSTIALGLKQVREIVKTQVPGRSGGGSVPSAPSLSSATAPLSPQAQTTSTLLNQNQLNQIGNAAVRAFVVESDVTTNQERIRMLNRRARL